MKNTSLVDDMKALNIIYSSDKYADFVSRFIKSFSKKNEYPNEFQISQSKIENQTRLVQNAGGYNLGYYPTGLTEEQDKQFTKKTLNFFTQFGAFSYSRYEVTLASLNDMISGLLKTEKLYSDQKSIHILSKQIIFTLLKDMVN